MVRRRVNHFWRLLNQLRIPHVTLLDLDSGRYQGGWGRVRNAMRQLNAVRPATFSQAQIDLLPKWDDDHDFPAPGGGPDLGGSGPIEALEQYGVFFSQPIDLDFMMLEAYPAAYGVAPTPPDQPTVVAVLGKKHMHETRLAPAVLELFDDYHSQFDLASKPATHLSALARLDDDELLKSLPEVLIRLLEYARTALDGLPE